jgi:hypothetical protein
MNEQNIPPQRPARPWDLLNKDIGRVAETIAGTRMYICTGCKHLNQITKTCKECGCFMPLKTKLPNAYCPVGKWNTAPKELLQETTE